MGYAKKNTTRNSNGNMRKKQSEYATQLKEKQKVKFIYGVLEKQFHGYFNKARKMNGVTGENLMIILESRLDNVVFRLGFARTRKRGSSVRPSRSLHRERQARGHSVLPRQGRRRRRCRREVP